MQDNRNYEFTGETMGYNGIILNRVRATRDFVNQGETIYAGTRGGWVENYSNLHGNAWVSHEAMVYGNATVFGQARVSDSACVFGYANVGNNARVCHDAIVYGNARVKDDSMVSGIVHGNVSLYGDSLIGQYAILSDSLSLTNANIEDPSHLLTVNLNRSSLKSITLYRTSNPNGYVVHAGFWHGTIEQLENHAQEGGWPNIVLEELQATIGLFNLRLKEWRDN